VSKNITLEKNELYKIALKYEYYDHEYINKYGDAARKPFVQKYGILKVRWVIPDEISEDGTSGNGTNSSTALTTTSYSSSGEKVPIFIDPEYLYHSTTSLPGYPLTRPVLHDQKPCIYIERIRNLIVGSTGLLRTSLQDFPDSDYHTNRGFNGSFYNPDAFCSWQIMTYQQKVHLIRFTAEFFDIEQSENCEFDRLDFWKGTARIIGGTTLATMCGKKSGVIYETNAQTLFLEFFANSAYERPGFQIRYTVVS
jgi:hypothetical protein